MPLNFDDLEIPIYRFLADELALSEFEQCLYATPALEAFLGQPAYLELLSFRYNQPSANYELARLLRSVIEPARSDTWQIIYFLQSLLEGTSDAVEAFARLFDLYGQGYTFLENIAIAYDIGVYEIPTLRQQPLWEASAFARQREALAGYIDPLRPEIQTILHGLETGAIRIISAGEYRLAPGWRPGECTETIRDI